jgi:hypothetical protein
VQLEAHPIHAFSQLLSLRRLLLSRLKSQPESVLSPLKLCLLSDEIGTLPMYYVYPQGTTSSLPRSQTVLEELVRLPESMLDETDVPINVGDRVFNKEKDAAAARIIYSSWELKKAEEFSGENQLADPWFTLLGFFAPAYKIALFGLRYRSMLEYDLLKAKRFLSENMPALVWKKYYEHFDDLSASYDYYHFYDLRLCHCDLCAVDVLPSEATVASAGTVIQSARFCEQYRRRVGDLAEFYGLGVDWSVWVLCRRCLALLE